MSKVFLEGAAKRKLQHLNRLQESLQHRTVKGTLQHRPEPLETLINRDNYVCGCALIYLPNLNNI